MTIFGGFITGGTVSTDPGDATKLTFSGIVINGALGAVAGDTFSAGGYQVPIASIDGTGAATLVYAFPVALDDVSAYAIARDSAERYNPAATNLLVRQYLAKIADASIAYVVPDGEDAPTELIAPDPQEGQKAIRFSNPWKTWLYTGGAWVEQPGSPGERGSTILAQDTEPSTDYQTNSIWIDSDSADLDVYELIGIPLAWTDTGINLKGASGATAWLPPVAWTTANNYVAGPPASLVTHGGESYVCLEDHESDDFFTDLAAGRWFKVAAKGADGTGTGDVTGPSSSVAGNFAAFSSTTGKAIVDSGKSISDFATDAQAVPAGGTTGQVLAKASAADNDTQWIDPTAGGGGGSGDVVGPATNSDSYIPQWNGANSKTLKNGLAVGTGANNVPQLDANGKLLNAVMGASSIGNPGYYTLPGGLIIQFGLFTPAANTSYSITFPVTFPNAVITFVMMRMGNAGNFDENLATLSTSQATGDSAIGSTTKGSVPWIAIGY